MKRKKTAGLIASVLLSVAVSYAYDVVGEGRTNSACGTQNDCTCNLNGFSWNPSTQRCEATANPSQCPSGSTFYSSFAGLNDVCVKPATVSYGSVGGRAIFSFYNGQFCVDWGSVCGNDISAWFAFVPSSWSGVYRIMEGVNLTSQLGGRYVIRSRFGNRIRPNVDYAYARAEVRQKSFLSAPVRVYWFNAGEWVVSNWNFTAPNSPDCYASLLNKGVSLQDNTVYVCLTRGGSSYSSSITKTEYNPFAYVKGFRFRLNTNFSSAGKVGNFYYPIGYFYYSRNGFANPYPPDYADGILQGFIGLSGLNSGQSAARVLIVSGVGSLSCPSGWSLVNGACVQNAQPTCPAGTQYDSNNNVCYYTGF